MNENSATMYTNLLKRQIKRHLPKELSRSSELAPFLEVINASYQHYERDNDLGKHSLEISSREMRQLSEEIIVKEARLRCMLEAATDGIILIDEKGKIKICNPLAAKYLGYDNSSSLIDKYCSECTIFFEEKQIFKESVISEITLEKILVLQTPKKLSEYLLIQPGKTPLPIEVTTSAFTFSSQQLTILVLRDISNRKEIEKKMALRHAITAFLFQATQLQKAAEKILKILCETITQATAIFWFKEEPDSLLTPICFYRQDQYELLHELGVKTFHLSFNSPTIAPKTTWLTQEKVLYPDGSFGGLSYIAFPLFFEKKYFGLVELYSTTYLPEDDQLVRILYDIGAEIGIFIERNMLLKRERELQTQLIEVARESGMMQVSTSVLHSVGNILNSVNVSLSLLDEHHKQGAINELNKIVSLLEEHQHDLGFFITEDTKGKKIPFFLRVLANWWEEEKKYTIQEISEILDHIQNIKNIITIQQSMVGCNGIQEELSLPILLDDLIAMHAKICEHNSIEIKKEYNVTDKVTLDKGRLIQILINMIQNGIEALENIEGRPKILEIKCTIHEKQLEIEVEDNGCGIDSKNLMNIFQLGFTTKKHGHGYGLHTCFLLAQQMGGQLMVKSSKVNQGTIFLLRIDLVEN